MFFISFLKQNIYLPPVYFNKEFKKNIFSSLLNSVEGKKNGPFGLIILVIEICNETDKGKILPGSSSVLYSLVYRAVTFRAMKGEVLDAIVTNITKSGFFAEAGILQIFISKQFIPSTFYFNEKQKFFQNNFYLEKKIATDKAIRIRILGLKEEGEFSQAIGTINEKFLGLI
mmetsp:Transcript_39355/g.78881  ORF Transcript_39355/g.78881 Transcript_39355/m.78881 type:complete len:172 (-) Transcript_39355:3407-3922(-)